MKTIVSINLGNFGSTGRIMSGISALAREKGFTAYEAYPDTPNNLPKKENDIIIGNYFLYRVSRKLSYETGYSNCFAYLQTIRFLRKLKKIRPDIIHIHNLHNSYINLRLLFRYIKKNHISVIWTFHDCWPFTGRCPYFQISGCEKWKSGCGNCPYPKDLYPESKVDRTKYLWNAKKKWFTGVENLTVVTPSQWLADLAKESFFSEYPIRVIPNGINLDAFQPTESDFRQKLEI